MTVLRERHNMQHKSRAVNINAGDVVMINDESKKSGKKKIGIFSELFQGKDDQIRDIRVLYVFKKLAKFTGKHMYWNLYLTKFQTLDLFSCEPC